MRKLLKNKVFCGIIYMKLRGRSWIGKFKNLDARFKSETYLQTQKSQKWLYRAICGTFSFCVLLLKKPHKVGFFSKSSQKFPRISHFFSCFTRTLHTFYTHFTHKTCLKSTWKNLVANSDLKLSVNFIFTGFAVPATV